MPSPASTPPVILDSLTRDGFRARTISDLASNLKIEIPGAAGARQLVFPPSPTESVQPRQRPPLRPRPTSLESSLSTLVPSSPPPVLEKEDSFSLAAEKLMGSPVALEKAAEIVQGKLLGSPIELGKVVELPAEEQEEKKQVSPRPPISPSHSWGSVSTLPSRPPSPKVASPKVEKEVVPTTPNSPVASPKVRPTLSLPLPLPLRPGFNLMTGPGLKRPLPLSRSWSASSLDEDLATPIEGKPQRGLEEVRYRLPRPRMSILSPVVASAGGRYEEDRKSPALAETGAFVVTGFLVGAFVTLFLVSTQRRTLLSLT